MAAEDSGPAAAGERPTSPVELCAYLVRGLVDAPDQVSVRQEEREDALALVVAVAPDDRGKVIGKGGRVVRALRTVVRAGSVRSGRKTLVEIEE